MSGPPGIGVDVKSLLKSIKGSCEKALEAFDGTRDSERLQAAADCLSEIEELIGGGKLPLYVEILKGAAAKRRNGS